MLIVKVVISQVSSNVVNGVSLNDFRQVSDVRYRPIVL